ncbi:MAG: hypothetical protein LUI07_02700 [Lachnospiraceae bacterium]|nr:hypothetical protein [Lachnospiraceae bacterium]
MNGKKIYRTGIYMVIYLLALLLMCLVFKSKTTAFWLGQGFSLLSVLCVFVSYGILEGKNREASYSGLSPVILSSVYFVVQILASIYIAWASNRSRQALILELVLLAVYLVLWMAALLGKGIADKSEAHTKEQIRRMAEIEEILKDGRSGCENPETEKYLSELIEAVHYSDPVSVDSVYEPEQELMSLAGKISAETADPAAVKTDCEQFKKVLDKRNRLCRAGK